MFTFDSFSIAGGKGHTTSFVDGSDGVYISRLTEGGIAHRDGKIQVGDRIVAVCHGLILIINLLPLIWLLYRSHILIISTD